MKVTRRDFLKFCTASAAALSLNTAGLKRLEAALESDTVPTLLWLHGSGCQGDSVSFLNLFTMVPEVDPVNELTVGRVLIESVNLAYHTVVMSAAGQTAVSMAEQAKRKGGYVLVLEGAVPTAFDGHACNIMTVNGQEVTYQQAIQDLAANALAIVCVGTCACYGGIPKSGSNPTAAVSVKESLSPGGVYSGPVLINVPGCPAHPAWVGWTAVQLILFRAGLADLLTLDANDRPTALYGNNPTDSLTLNIHENCPRNLKLGGSNERATTFGQDGKCLENLGCRGPVTFSDCPSRRWNNGENGPANWCIDANAPCLGCVEPTFPGGDFYSF